MLPAACRIVCCVSKRLGGTNNERSAEQNQISLDTFEKSAERTGGLALIAVQ